jgi:hypothetical protein
MLGLRKNNNNIKPNTNYLLHSLGWTLILKNKEKRAPQSKRISSEHLMNWRFAKNNLLREIFGLEQANCSCLSAWLAVKPQGRIWNSQNAVAEIYTSIASIICWITGVRSAGQIMSNLFLFPLGPPGALSWPSEERGGR